MAPHFTVVAIQQKYAGHAKQAGVAAVSAATAARNGCSMVVVREGIDLYHYLSCCLRTR